MLHIFYTKCKFNDFKQKAATTLVGLQEIILASQTVQVGLAKSCCLVQEPLENDPEGRHHQGKTAKELDGKHERMDHLLYTKTAHC